MGLNGTREHEPPFGGSKVWVIPWAIALVALIAAAVGIWARLEAIRGFYANSDWPIGRLQSIAAAQKFYRERGDDKAPHEYAATLHDLVAASLLSPVFEAPVEKGWQFRMERPTPTSFMATARPAPGEPPAARTFFIDESGVVRAATGGIATSLSAPIAEPPTSTAEPQDH